MLILSRRMRLTIRSLLGLTAICGVAFALLHLHIASLQRERATIDGLRDVNHQLLYDNSWMPPHSLHEALGINSLACAEHFRMWRNARDHNLLALANLTNLKSLVLHSPHISDAGIETLRTLTHLETLWLQTPNVTPQGRESLSELTNLRFLRLDGLPLTDACLRKFRRLKRLEYLYIVSYYEPCGHHRGNDVTQSALEEFQRELPTVEVITMPN